MYGRFCGSRRGSHDNYLFCTNRRITFNDIFRKSKNFQTISDNQCISKSKANIGICKVRLFFRLLSHDITEGIIHNRKFFIFATLLFIFIDFVYWHNISLYFSDYNSVVDCGVLDFFMNVFAGCDPFDPEANKGVDIPITWFSFNVLPYLFVGLYITNDLQTSADTFILRVKSRYLWWLSKIVWCVVSSTLYYLLFFVISTAFTLLSGNFSLTQNSLITEEFLELSTYGKSMTEIFISSVLLPWMITTCHMTFDAKISSYQH